MFKLNLGAGNEPREDFINLDIRPIQGSIDVQANLISLPFVDHSFIEIVADSVLEHLSDPRPAIAEMARVLVLDGSVQIKVPALGTNAASLDPTHRYLADLKHWKELMQESFEQVSISSVGVRWRMHKSLVLLQRLTIWFLNWHELGQCWVITARRPRSQCVKKVPHRWWLDEV